MTSKTLNRADFTSSCTQYACGGDNKQGRAHAVPVSVPSAFNAGTLANTFERAGGMESFCSGIDAAQVMAPQIVDDKAPRVSVMPERGLSV